MNQITDTASSALLAGEAAFDPIEERLRANVRATIEAVFEEELDSFLGRLRYSRGDGAAKGYRHGHRERQLTGTFGTETVRVPRARIEDDAGKVTEWRSKALPRYQRLTKKADMAFEVMSALRNVLGLRIPEDVSLIGFDDVPMAGMPEFALTTIRQPLSQMAANTTRMMVEAIRDHDAEAENIAFAPKLVTRATVRRRPE